MKVSRRGLLHSAGTLVVGATIGGLGLSLPKEMAGQEPVKELPWPYKKLNPETVAEIAYQEYYKGACCYGVFESIIGQLRKEIGSPYTTIPTKMMVFGEGGISGIASVCGALNGAAAAIFLIVGGFDKPKREPAFMLTRELFNWYEQAALPDFKPKKVKFEIVQSVSRSTLCHASVSSWCKIAKVKSFSPQRSERCGWLTGAVAKYTVELMNKQTDGNFKAAHPISASVQTCMDCHEKGGSLENTRSMMDCGGCHFTPKTKHPQT
jgi:hypothetical protein